MATGRRAVDARATADTGLDVGEGIGRHGHGGHDDENLLQVEVHVG